MSPASAGKHGIPEHLTPRHGWAVWGGLRESDGEPLTSANVRIRSVPSGGVCGRRLPLVAPPGPGVRACPCSYCVPRTCRRDDQPSPQPPRALRAKPIGLRCAGILDLTCSNRPRTSAGVRAWAKRSSLSWSLSPPGGCGRHALYLDRDYPALSMPCWRKRFRRRSSSAFTWLSWTARER
jgi:hypothetical protein